MALLYLDTSALVKLYVQEVGSDQLLALVNHLAHHRLAMSSLARVEFRSAVRRRQRAGDLNASQAQSLIASLTQHSQNLFIVQPVTEAILEEAQLLVDALALRAYDAMQLASAKSLAQTTNDRRIFVCADVELCSAASRQGLSTFNPERDDPVVVQ